MVMLLLLGCATPAPPDPDALMRQGHLDEALTAWEAQGGRHIPADHPTATTLAKRSANETWITLPVLADLTEAATADRAQIDACGSHLLREAGHLAGLVVDLDDELPGHRSLRAAVPRVDGMWSGDSRMGGASAHPYPRRDLVRSRMARR